MNIVIFGPQGSGKGTQSKLIVEKYKLTHISPGELFRQEARKGSSLGNKLRVFMDKGLLVPNTINFVIVKQALASIKFQNFIIDGFPRTIEQAKFLDTKANIDFAIEVHISDKEALQRISSRYFCSICKKDYNTISLRPKKAGICDNCKGSLVQRDDDRPAAVKKRLAIYHAQTEPLKKYYKKQGKLIVIKGEQPIDDVFKDIQQAIQKMSGKKQTI